LACGAQKQPNPPRERFIVRADEKLTAFVELESVVCTGGELPRQAGEIFPKIPGS
jgi:hypothetical protein